MVYGIFGAVVASFIILPAVFWLKKKYVFQTKHHEWVHGAASAFSIPIPMLLISVMIKYNEVLFETFEVSTNENLAGAIYLVLSCFITLLLSGFNAILFGYLGYHLADWKYGDNET
ncbi:MAG: hypothetical protein GKR91_12555 [Pseudomonadales bacterium]|nr:hypothetical protein [Pseudomonadales bacterium]